MSNTEKKQVQGTVRSLHSFLKDSYTLESNKLDEYILFSEREIVSDLARWYVRMVRSGNSA